MSLVFTTDDKKLSSECVEKLYKHIAEFEKFTLSKNASYRDDKIATLNAFLEEIRLALISETKVTKKSYIIIGCYLHAFSMLYDTLVSNGACKKDCETLVGKEKEWTKFLCSKNGGRPMHLLYKWLATLGLMLTPCACLYLADSRKKGHDVELLSRAQVIKNFYNPLLHISARNTIDCIATINDIERLTKARKLLSSASRVRDKFLTSKYCEETGIKGDSAHAAFERKLNSINDALIKRINELS